MAENRNPLSLIRAFGLWREANHLDPMAELLWYKLWQLFNRLGWPEWVQIDIPRLAAMIGKREGTAITHRNTLISHGLLGYRKGKKGDPSRYSIKFPAVGAGQSGGMGAWKAGGETAGESGREKACESRPITRQGQDKDANPLVKKTHYNGAWRTDARAARAVAQNVLDRLPGLEADGYPYANQAICDAFAIGMTPQQALSALEGCAKTSYIPAHLHSYAVYLGLEDEEGDDD